MKPIVKSGTGKRVLEAYKDGGPLWKLTLAGLQPRQLVPVDIFAGEFRQFFRVVWAAPDEAKAAASEWLVENYCATNISFWKAPHSLPQDFYAQFTMNRGKSE